MLSVMLLQLVKGIFKMAHQCDFAPRCVDESALYANIFP